jgi:hypothetical protein
MTQEGEGVITAHPNGRRVYGAFLSLYSPVFFTPTVLHFTCLCNPPMIAYRLFFMRFWPRACQCYTRLERSSAQAHSYPTPSTTPLSFDVPVVLILGFPGGWRDDAYM